MADGNEALPVPVEASERVEALDAVRGFALLGILLMNICGFGMPSAAESNPTVWGGATGADYWLWWVEAVFWSGKMRALFSICFGAGVIYLTSRAEAKGLSAADIYYRRTLWLMLFGMIHAYLIWYGDILYFYSLSGLVLYPLRKLPPRWLMGVGVTMVGILCAASAIVARDLVESKENARGIPPYAQVAKEVDSARSAYESSVREWQPPAERLESERKAYLGSYAVAYANRAEVRSGTDSLAFYSVGNWDILAFMLIGMALARWGVFAGSWPLRTCAGVAVAGIAAGAAVGIWTVNREAASGFSVLAAMESEAVYQFVRLTMALGYLAAIVGAVQAGWLPGVIGPLRAVGRMALTNYILQSLIGTTIFYGHGLGWFGTLKRHELYYVVAAIWLLQWIASPLWLKAFRFGPLEWVWRSLTYWQRQPMRRASTSGQSLPAENPA